MTIARLDGFDQYYQTFGEGPPLLLLHGLGSSADDWEMQVPVFASGYRVIVPDLRGHSRSDKPEGPYSIAQFARDMAALLHHLEAAPAHVVGWSLGAAVAFQLAVDHPQLVKTLTVVNGTPELVLRTFAQKFALAQRLAIIRLLGMRRFSAILAGRVLPDPEQKALRAQFAERFRHNQTRPYLTCVRALVGWSVMEQLEQIRVPALVVSGDDDYTPVTYKESFVARMPNARLSVIPKSRHLTPVEQPEAFNRVLHEFLGTHG